VLVHAFDQAARVGRPALHILAVVPDEGRLWHRPSEGELEALEAQAKAALVEVVLRVMDDAVPAATRDTWQTRLHVRRGRPEEQIIDLAGEVNAELLVIGRYGHAARKHLGSTADRVVARAECPVLIVTGGRETVAAERQCPACVAIRAESDGEQWFCADHHGERVGVSVALHGSQLTRGGW